MFFELLKSREVKSQIDATNNLIEGISSSGQKLEELIKSLYLSSNEDDAQKQIELIDVYSDTLGFYRKPISPAWTHKDPDTFDFSRHFLSANIRISRNIQHMTYALKPIEILAPLINQLTH